MCPYVEIGSLQMESVKFRCHTGVGGALPMRLAPDIQGTFGRRDTESTRWRPEQGCYKQETTRSWERGQERMLPEAPDGALPCTAHTSSPDIQPLTCETKSFCCLSHDLWHFVTVALTKKNVLETS